LWCRKGEAFCVRPFVLHRQQPEKGEQNVDFALLEKFLRMPMLLRYVALAESSGLNLLSEFLFERDEKSISLDFREFPSRCLTSYL